MHVIQTSAGPLIRSKLLDGVKGIVHGFGVGGAGLAQYLDALSVADRFLVQTNQVHGNCVHYLMWPKKGSPLVGDAFITDRPGMVCYVRTADCAPILIADRIRPAIAAVHAGWRGMVNDVVGETISAMKSTFGVNPTDCVAVVGPSICGQCYEVGPEVIDAMSAVGFKGDWRVDAKRVDLSMAALELLSRAGLSSSNVAILPQCTKCQDEFASHRRNGTKERQVSFIVLK